MGYKYLKRGIRIGFSFTLGMILLLSGCSGEMEEMQTSQIPEDMGSATELENVNLVELDSSIVELEKGLFAVRYDGDYGFDGFIAGGGASSDGEVITYLADNLLSGLNLGDLLGGVFGCSTIAVQSPEWDTLFGRNFDWKASISCRKVNLPCADWPFLRFTEKIKNLKKFFKTFSVCTHEMCSGYARRRKRTSGNLKFYNPG